MSHTTDIESRSDPDGLREIRSWASRSPGSARPGFRLRQWAGAPRLSPRLVGSALLVLLLVLFSMAGYGYFSQSRQDTPRQAAVPALDTVPELEEVPEVRTTAEAPPAPLPAETEILPDSLQRQTRTEPLRIQAISAARTVSRERPLPAAAVLRREPVPEEQPAASRIEMSPDVFESEPAVLLAAPTVDYPEAARGTGTSARVTVGFTIDETGTVRNPMIESIRIQGDAPKAPFEEAALAAIRQARFTPAQERGVPTRSWSTLTFSFETGVPAGI